MLNRRQVPFFNYRAVFEEVRDEATAAVESVLSSGAFIMQRDLADFESELASYLGVRHAIGVADGTMGLLLPLLALDLQREDEVILPAHTFVASAAAIHHAGGSPVLADCRSDHLIDPESVERAITSRTRGIMPVQLNGRTADMDALTGLAERHDLFIVEDSCQALGSRYKNRLAGTFGLAGAFSFYPSKTLGCFGDGGAVVTENDDLAERIRTLRDHGRTADGDVSCWGYNARLDNVQAAVLRIKLGRYQSSIAKRRELAAIYDGRLQTVPQLLLPPPPSTGSDHFDIFQNYEIEAEDRDGLRAHLDAMGVGTILQWGGQTLQQFPALALRGDVPNTDAMTAKFMLLPLNTSLAEDDIHYVCDCIDQFYS